MPVLGQSVCSKEKAALRREAVISRYTVEGPEILAKEFGCSVRAITHVANRLGLLSLNHYARIALNKSLATQNVDLHYFDQPTGPNSWMRGYIQADGCLTDDYEIKFGCSTKDEELLVLIKRELKSNHSLSRIPGAFDSVGRWRGPKSQLQVCGRALGEKLFSLGVRPRKSTLDCPFPDIQDQYLHDYCRGVLDGDGSVNIRNTTGQPTLYWAGTETFINQLRDRVVSSVDVTKHPVHQDDNVFRISWSAKEDLQKLYWWLYPQHESSYPALSRKRMKLWEVVGA